MHEEILKDIDSIRSRIECIKKKDPCIHYTVALSQLLGLEQWIKRKDKLIGGKNEN